MRVKDGATLRVLTLNCGSSSLKFDVIDVRESEPPEAIAIGRGSVDFGAQRGEATLRVGGREHRASLAGSDQESAFGAALALLHEAGIAEVAAVGHRVVHGGHHLTAPVRVDDVVLHAIEAATSFAPLHNGPALRVLRAALTHFGDAVPMAVTFDTGFYAALPTVAATYALPRRVEEELGVRRYGFHGLAHRSMVEMLAEVRAGRPSARLITLQLGGGCSVTATRDGMVVDTSMGFTPLEGLVMATRSGDLDPSIPLLLARRLDQTPGEVEAMLNNESGLLGISGLSGDMRVLQRAARDGHDRARLAIEVFCYRAAKYVGAYLAVLGGADAIVFGGGIGEHDADVRARICGMLTWAGVDLDVEANHAASGTARISRTGARIEAWTVAVDEAVIIARDTATLIQA